MKIDISKKYQTRDGQKVELITTSGRTEYCILGYVSDEDFLQEWLPSGQWGAGKFDSDLDLIEVKED